MPPDEDSGFAGLTVVEVMSQLEACRAELTASASNSAEIFRTSVRGGIWTAAKRRVVAVSVRSEAWDTATNTSYERPPHFH